MASNEEKRRERIQIIRDTFNKANKEGRHIDEELLIKHLMIEWGASRRTIQGYLEAF